MITALFTINIRLPKNTARRTCLLTKLVNYSHGLVTSDSHRHINPSSCIQYLGLSFALADALDAGFGRTHTLCEFRPKLSLHTRQSLSKVCSTIYLFYFAIQKLFGYVPLFFLIVSQFPIFYRYKSISIL